MKKFFLFFSLTLLFFSCKKDNDNKNVNPTPIIEETGYLYTSTNDPSGNSIIIMERFDDGSLLESSESPLATNGLGAADQGDFDGQGSIIQIDNHLLVVNAGRQPEFNNNGSISVFEIDKSSGKLTQINQKTETEKISNINSNGVRPVSITHQMINGIDWVLVANQYANPLGGSSIENTELRNIAAYTFDRDSGILTFSKIVATYYEGNWGGPACVKFSHSGARVAVSLWGIAVLEAAPDTLLQKPSRVLVYDFVGDAKADPNLNPISNKYYWQKTGVAGSIGTIWSKDDQNIYVSNFNLSKYTPEYTVTNFTLANNEIKLAGYATIPQIGNETCWIISNKLGNKIYTASFTGNLTTEFSVASDNSIEYVKLKKRHQTIGPDTKDMAWDHQERFLYVSGAFETHSMATFTINADGSIDENSNSPYVIPSSKNKLPSQQAFLGLVSTERVK